MATTEQQISAALTTLGFNNASNVAIFEKIAQAVGIPIDNTLTELSNNKTDILNIINKQRYGKTGYYTGVALAFQYGDNLVIDPVTFDNVYAVIDTTKQVITQAAFEEIATGSNSQLFLKIASLNVVTGLLQQPSGPQLAAFKNYFVNYEIPGIPVTIIANPANIINFYSAVTYYATYDFATLQTNIAAALIAFRDTFQFNGEFFNGDLSDYLKTNVPGIRNVYLSGTTIDGIAFSGSAILGAGYFNYSLSITTNFNYTAING
jgi:hypothetical protein